MLYHNLCVQRECVRAQNTRIITYVFIHKKFTNTTYIVIFLNIFDVCCISFSTFVYTYNFHIYNVHL